LALLSLTIALAYLVPMILHREILLHIQYGISIVITVGVIEVSAWYFYRKERNDTGLVDQTQRWLMLVVFLANVKRTITRVLVLLMAMGVGVVESTLGNARTIKIAIWAAAFLSFSIIRESIQEMQSLEKLRLVSQMTLFSIVVPAALLDIWFECWAILSLIRTIQKLTLREQALKLGIYKWFFGLLALTGVISLCFAVYMFALQLNPKLGSWQTEWIRDMFWEILFVALMGAIAVLWRPRANNARYAYEEDFSTATGDKANSALVNES